MTREDIIRWANEAGLPPGYDDALERYATLVAAGEREACARVCDAMHEEDHPGDYAYAIRARSKTCCSS